MLILIGIIFQIVQLVVSIRHREELRDRTGDPWDGRSLEWATASPPPVFNFAIPPEVRGEDAYWAMKTQRAAAGSLERRARTIEDIEMPRNSPTGFVCAFFATIMGFALIWHIWWMVAAGCVGAFATFVVFAWRDHDEYVIPAAEVARIDRANLRGTARASCRYRRECVDDRRDLDVCRRATRITCGPRRACRARLRSASSPPTASGFSSSATS